MVHEASPLPAEELKALLCAYPYHALVFILPPWESIYTNDAERDQSFADAVSVHARLEQWYGSCGYILQEVPRLPVPQRADYILQVLAQSAA
jgi:predicted ATPase